MIQYPGGIKIRTAVKKTDSHKNRGMVLETDINTTNEYYRETDLAIIYKKPTPIQVSKVEHNKITEAYFKERSTSDYCGVYKGLNIDFEAKETKSKTRFDCSLIQEHQLEHLYRVHKHGSIAFIIVRFSELETSYLVYVKDYIQYITNSDRQSVPIDWFKTHAYVIEYRYTIPCDYLAIIKEHLKEKL